MTYKIPLAYLKMANVSPEDWVACLSEQVQILGRAPSSQIRTPASFRQVSRQHAEFSAENGRVLLRDLGSHTGTQVNGVWLEPTKTARLAPGDRLWFGGLELIVVDEISTIAKVLAEASSRPIPIINLKNDNEDDSTVHFIPVARLRSPARDALSTLSRAELEIVLWIGRGYFEDQEIATKLHRSPHTIRTQIVSIFRKLEVNSRPELMAFIKRQSSMA